MAVASELYDVADESFARVPPATLVAHGYQGIVRYATGKDKSISRSEYQADVAAGLPVALVQEGGNQPAMRGYAGGVADAQAANQAADAIGFPRDRPIYFVAEDPSPLATGAWPTVVSYFQGVASVGGRPAGGYGGRGLLEHLHGLGLIGFVWQVSTWGQGISPLANIVQQGNPNESTLGGQVDENDVLTADWGQYPPPHSVATTTGVFMPGEVEAIEAHVDASISAATRNIDQTVQDTRTDLLNVLQVLQSLSDRFDKYVAAHP